VGDGFVSDHNRLRILGIGGSTRQGSYSQVALKRVLTLTETLGAQPVLADVRALALPVYDEDWALAEYPSTPDWLLD
jgi:NAD(P)H-dependent FMN reductase